MSDDDDDPLSKNAKKPKQENQEIQDNVSESNSHGLFWNTFEEVTGMTASKSPSYRKRGLILI